MKKDTPLFPPCYTYSGIAVQLQQGDCTDAADVLQVFSLCVLQTPAETVAGVAGGVDWK